METGYSKLVPWKSDSFQQTGKSGQKAATETDKLRDSREIFSDQKEGIQ